MDRRKFLHAFSTAGAGTIVLGPGAWAATSADGAAANRRLVVVFQRGAADGLNIVVPYVEESYYRLRPRIAIAKPGEPGGALDLDGRFGLHPSLAPMLPFWQQKSLAFVHASGSPHATRSHFAGQDNIESGAPGSKAVRDGWLNRLVGALPADAELRAAPNRAISVGETTPRIFLGSQRVATLASGNAATAPSALDRPGVHQLFAAVYKGDAKMGAAFEEHAESRSGVNAALSEAKMGRAEAAMQAANNGAPPAQVFVGDAGRLAALMRHDPRVQFGFLAVGGWDTHANQGGARGQLANLLSPFAQGMAALAQGLGPVYADTTIVVISEFGRAVAQNGNGGTDHGHGNVMWLMGGRVAGGKLHGEWPGLAELHENRDLKVVTDFRTVLAQVCERHMRLPDAKLSEVFPAMPGSAAPLDLLA